MAKTGKLNEKSVDIALRALKRFRVLAEQAGAISIHALATAAAREARNGPDFIAQAEAILGRHIEVLSGKEEAYYSALGIISGFYKPQGVTGDLGGGSLELVSVNDHEVGEGSRSRSVAFVCRICLTSSFQRLQNHPYRTCTRNAS